jgi:NNP family nitrate/nitrite transporter-like MFS transporter
MHTTVVRGTPIQGLVGATLGFFIGFAAVSLFSPTAESLQTLTGFTPAMAGLLVSVPNLTGSLLRIPFAAMVDGDGGKRPLLILLVLATAGLGGLAILFQAGERVLVDLYPLVLFLGALGGCGIATFSVGISQTAYWFPQSRQGTALGTYAGVGNLAPGIFAFLLTSVTIPVVGLANSYVLWALVLLAGTVAYAVLGRNAWYFQLRRAGHAAEEAREAARRYGQELFPRGTATEALGSAFRTGSAWALVVLYFTTFGGFLALTAWLPVYFKSYMQTSIAWAGSFTAIVSIVASLTRVAGGSISDKLGGYRTSALALSVVALGSLVVVFSQSLVLSVALLILVGTGMGINNAAVFKLVPRLVPQAVGGASGIVGGLGAFGGFVLPNLLAAFLAGGGAEDHGYRYGFLVFVALALVSLAIVYILRKVVEGGAGDQ